MTGGHSTQGVILPSDTGTITPEVPLPLPDRSERSNNPGAGTITPKVPLPLPGPEPLP